PRDDGAVFLERETVVPTGGDRRDLVEFGRNSRLAVGVGSAGIDRPGGRRRRSGLERDHPADDVESKHERDAVANEPPPTWGLVNGWRQHDGSADLPTSDRP